MSFKQHSPARRSREGRPEKQFQKRLRYAASLDAESESALRAERLLQRIEEISGVLARFDSVEHALMEVITLLGDTMPLSSAIFLLETTGQSKTVVWRAPDLSDADFDVAEQRAHASYEYLRGGHARSNQAVLRGAGRVVSADRNSILLPLVTGYGSVFGALQLGSTNSFTELDLAFVSAVINQLSVAIDRQTQLEFARTVACSVTEGIIAVDLRKRVTFLNPASERWLGMSERAALGRPVNELLEVCDANCQPLTQAADPLNRVISERVSVRSDEHIISCKNGTQTPASYTAAPIEREHIVWGAVLVFRDILELKRSENRQRLLSEATALLGSSLDYQKTLQIIAHLVVPRLAELCVVDLLDSEMHVERLEPVCAAPALESVAARLREFAPRLDWETPEAKVLRSAQALLCSELRGPALRAVARDGEHERLLRALGIHSLMIVPMNVGTRILGALTFGASDSRREFSDGDLELARELARRAASAVDNVRRHREAEEAIQVREDVVSIVSHDLKTPLSSLTMSANALQSFDEMPQRARRYVEIMARGAGRMTTLIDQLLDFTKIYAGHIDLTLRSESARTLIDETMSVLEPLAEARSLHVEQRWAHANAVVLCDRGRILQVFANLVSNAVKFTPEGGSIVLAAAIEQGNASFSVADSGPGIPEDELPHLFERYWQAPRTARKGVGLGLAIAKGIVVAHGGEIWVESPPGQGATFHFTLPLAGSQGGSGAPT